MEPQDGKVKVLGSEIRAMRVKAGKTQQQVADLAGWGIVFQGNIERTKTVKLFAWQWAVLEKVLADSPPKRD